MNFFRWLFSTPKPAPEDAPAPNPDLCLVATALKDEVLACFPNWTEIVLTRYDGGFDVRIIGTPEKRFLH